MKQNIIAVEQPECRERTLDIFRMILMKGGINDGWQVSLLRGDPGD